MQTRQLLGNMEAHLRSSMNGKNKVPLRHTEGGGGSEGVGQDFRRVQFIDVTLKDSRVIKSLKEK